MMSLLGRRIHSIRAELGHRVGHRVTLTEFGELIGAQEGRPPYRHSTVSRWENGLQAPAPQTLAAIAKLGEIPIEQLLDRPSPFALGKSVGGSQGAWDAAEPANTFPEDAEQHTPRRARLTAEYYAHRYLWWGARLFFERATSRGGGDAYDRLGALLFIYFALESYLNDLGGRISPTKWANERKHFGRPPYRGTRGKLDFLLDRCHLVVRKDQRPYVTVVELTARRHRLVHARTQVVDEIRTFTRPDELEANDQPEFEQLADQSFLQRAMEDVEELCDELQRAANALLPNGKLPGLRSFTGILGTRGGSILPDQGSQS